FPELTVTDILEGIQLLDEEGFIEETHLDVEKTVPERYKPNVNYFSRFIGTRRKRFDIQQKINETSILLLGLGGGGSNILTLLA
ncbi:hypothetical protein, partial [Mesorhizobium sp. M7A.F.Ca.MR.362.00.0.0]